MNVGRDTLLIKEKQDALEYLSLTTMTYDSLTNSKRTISYLKRIMKEAKQTEHRVPGGVK
jgi:hypothetical protein